MNIGTINTLQVIKQVEFGVYLDGGEFGEILLPKRYAPNHLAVEDNIDVFIYCDSDDRLIATTEIPLAMVGECAWLKVKDVNRVGAFLDWGLPKDLLVPYNEQYSAMEVGKYYPVCVLLDNETNRIAASSKLYQFLEEQTDDFTPQQTVNLLIIQQTDLGFKAVINHTHLGLIFHSDVFQNLQLGQKIKGYIKEIRDDGKINLSLQPHTHEVREELSETILDYLKQNGGSTTLTDKSPPEEIYQQFQVSKSNYKKALGALYRQRIINIDKQKITLLDTTDQSANEPDKSP